MTHGGPTSSVRHVGDLGNIQSTNGTASVNITDSVAMLNAVLGRAIVVHASVDDYGLG